MGPIQYFRKFLRKEKKISFLNVFQYLGNKYRRKNAKTENLQNLQKEN